MAENKSNGSRLWVTLVVLLIAALLLYFMLPSSRDKVTVRAARAERQALINTIATNGRVEPIEDFQAHAPMASVVQDLPVHLGEVVTQGQELVRRMPAMPKVSWRARRPRWPARRDR